MKLAAETIPAKARRRVAEAMPSRFDALIRAALPEWSAGEFHPVNALYPSFRGLNSSHA